MTKEEFKARWEKDETGGGITFDDIADCAKDWGISSRPCCCNMYDIRYRVLKAANCSDAEDFVPKYDEDEED